jgi:hypothetical protein
MDSIFLLRRNPEVQMRKVPFAEWFLAQAIGSVRATAIYGDLEELAAARGRLWFWTAYVRMLISLGWRTGGPAFIVGWVCTYQLAPLAWRAMRTLFHPLRGVSGLYHVSVLYVPLGNALLGLFFLLPFLMVRFGLRDRVTQLAYAIFILTLPYFCLYPAVVEVIAPVTAIAVIAGLCLRGWRRPMIVLTLALATHNAFIAGYTHLPYGLPFSHLHGRMIGAPLALAWATTAAVCLYLHRRLLTQCFTIA